MILQDKVKKYYLNNEITFWMIGIWKRLKSKFRKYQNNVY